MVCVIRVYVQEIGGVWFSVALRDGGVLGVNFGGDKKTVGDILRGSFVDRGPVEVFMEPPQQFDALFVALRGLYDGKDVSYCFILADFDLPVYSQRVLRAVSAIPVGYVASYGGVAWAVGGGARAVGNVMAANFLPLIIPCHRVVKSDLGLGGYGVGGLGVKLELLKREQRGYGEVREIERGRGVLRVFPTEAVVKKYV